MNLNQEMLCVELGMNVVIIFRSYCRVVFWRLHGSPLLIYSSSYLCVPDTLQRRVRHAISGLGETNIVWTNRAEAGRACSHQSSRER